MFTPPVPKNDDERIESLRELGLLDASFVDAYDSIVKLTRMATHKPICLFSIVDRYRQFFKAGIGLPVRQTSRHQAFCASTICQEDLNSIFHIEDALEHPHYRNNPLVLDEPKIRFYAGIPVLSPDGYPVGTVCVIGRKAEALHGHVADSLRSAKLLMESALTLQTRSVTDSLTGLFNRRHFGEQFKNEWDRARRHATTLSVLMIDVDHFKEFNDRYGHQAGDDALAQVADCLSACICRPGDVLARYGGEEFIMLLPDTGIAGAREMAARCIQMLLDRRVTHETADGGHLTISVGAASVSAVGAFSHADLAGGINSVIASADGNLYAAKKAGRNRAVCSEMISNMAA